MKSSRHFFAGWGTLLPLALICLFSCNEPDIRLVNKVKTFEPKWAELNDKLTYLDRNLDIAEDRFEKDFAELEGMLGQVPDSLRDRTYRKNLARYDTLVMQRDTIRSIYTVSKEECGTNIEDYNEWEKKVMDGSIDSSEGDTTLKAYKEVHARLDHSTDSVTQVLETAFADHNSILRDLARRIGIFQNFDIRMQ